MPHVPNHDARFSESTRFQLASALTAVLVLLWVIDYMIR